MKRKTRDLRVLDNIEALAGYAPQRVTLAYVDPPFNSGRAYDAIVAPRSAGLSHRREAFADSWHWSEEVEALQRRLGELIPKSVESLVADLVRNLAGTDMAAYLVMMAPRLSLIRDALANDGSLYVHCDSASSHYLRVLLDRIFGPENFRNEVVWKRTHAHSSSRRFGPVHDTLLFYSRSSKYVWNPTFVQYSQAYLDGYYTHEDGLGRYQLITCTAPGDRTNTRAHYDWRGKLPPPGRHWAWKCEQMQKFESEGRLVYSANGTPRLKRYISEGRGVSLQDVWTDINRLDAHSDERVGYDTQKPVALLERIIRSSSNPGDLVLDPFCGTGTSLVAAERLGRSWIGIDNSLLACSIALARVRQEVNLKDVTLVGFPADTSSALRILQRYPSAFGIWGTSMLATLPDRYSSTGRMTAGAGSIQGKRRHFELISLVPLRSNAVRVLPRQRLGHLSKLGLILNTGPAATDLKRWLNRQLDIPVHMIGLDSLVQPSSLARGISSEVLALASSAT